MQALKMLTLLEEIMGIEFKITLAIDNKPCVQLLESIGAVAWRTRHLKIKGTAMAQARVLGLIDIVHCSGEVEIADALTDILYVVYGAGHAFGIDLDDCFSEVHRSNMTKLGANGRPLYREDGKVMKGPNYSEPDLTQFLL